MQVGGQSGLDSRRESISKLNLHVGMCPIGVTSIKRLLLVHGGADAGRIGDAGRFLEGHGAVVPWRFRRGRGGALGLAPLDRYIVASSQGGRPRAEPGQVRRARRRGHRRVPPAAAMRGGAGAGAAVHGGRSGMQHLGVIPHAVDRPMICTVSSTDGISLS
jgi:hypothetical protein